LDTLYARITTLRANRWQTFQKISDITMLLRKYLVMNVVASKCIAPRTFMSLVKKFIIHKYIKRSKRKKYSHRVRNTRSNSVKFNLRGLKQRC